MKKQSWKIRKAVIADAAQVAALMRAAYAPHAARLNGQTLPPLAVNYEDEIREYPVWVAQSGAALLGALVLTPQKEIMQIANVAVDPRAQGQGLGRGLMNYAEAEAVRLGFSEMQLATHVAFTENISLYAHLGWREAGRAGDRVYMRKSIK